MKKEQILTFDYFLESQKIVQRYFCKFVQANVGERLAARRALQGQEGFEELFKKSIMEQTQWEEITKD